MQQRFQKWRFQAQLNLRGTDNAAVQYSNTKKCTGMKIHINMLSG